MSKKDNKAYITVLARFLLGLMLLGAGITKFLTGYSAFVEKTISGLSELTFIPWALAAAVIYILPIIEIAIGIALVIGLKSPTSFSAAGLLLAILALGQFFLGNPANAANNSVYVIISLIGIWASSEGYDKWCLG